MINHDKPLCFFSWGYCIHLYNQLRSGEENTTESQSEGWVPTTIKTFKAKDDHG